MTVEDYTKYDDLTLFSLIKRDDERAFKVIFERHRRSILALVYNGLHDKEASQEIVQEIFFYLWHKRATLTITTSLKGYLHLAARHAMLNTIRSRKLRKAYAADFYLFASGLADNSNVEWQNVNDLEYAIERSLRSLPEKCKTVFHLSRRQHLPINNIALQLNVSTKTVENYLTQALKHLRTSLSDYTWMLIIVAFI